MPYEADRSHANANASANGNWLGAHSPVVLSRLLRRFADENLSGDLQVVSGTFIKRVRVNKGKVRFATSNLRQDRLGESMLAHEFIDERAFELASDKMRADGCRFGEALLRLGRVTEKELHKELAVQVQRIVLSLFRVKDGLYTFDEANPSDIPELPFGLSVPPLLLKGLRRVTDEGELLEVLPPAATRVRVSQSPLYAIDSKKLSRLERAVLDEAGPDGCSIGQILGATTRDRSETLRSCYALLTVGLLEPVPDDVAPVVVPAGPRAETAKPAKPAKVDEPLRKLAQEGEAELLSESEEDLTFRLVDESEPGPEGELAMSGADETPAIAELESLVEAPPEPPNEAWRIVEEEELPDPVKRPAVGGATGMDESVRRARRKQFERDARLHLQVKDFQGAIPLLRELVALDPDRAQYRAMLGQAMQHHPATRKNAEHHLLEAVRLKPRNVKMHLVLAIYYKRTGQKARALSTFEKVLRLDPGNENARRHLLSYGEQAGVKSLLKKLFG